MINEERLREILAEAATAVPRDVTRSARALYQGRRRRRGKMVQRASAALMVVVVTATTAVLLLNRSSAPARVAYIDCARSVAQGEMRVAASEDGLQIRVRNATTSLAQIAIAEQGGVVGPGGGQLRLAVPPGRHEIACTTDRGTRTVGTIDVIDNHGLWAKDTSLACARPSVEDMTDRFLLGTGDPTRLTSQRLALAPQDKASTVGYPEGDQRLVAVIRDNHTVAIATWHQLLPGTWTLGVLRSCSSSVRPAALHA